MIPQPPDHASPFIIHHHELFFPVESSIVAFFIWGAPIT
jgi:hypothetical protein